MITVKSYLKSARLHKTINYLFVVFGFLLTKDSVNTTDILALLFLYVVFALVIYGGLYSINYVSEQPKSNQNIKIARVAVTSITAGLFIIYVYFPSIFSLVLVICLLNIFYSLLLKRYSIIIAMLLIAMTGPIKVAIGITLAEASPARFVLLLVLHYACSFFFHTYQNYRRGLLKQVNYL